MTHARGREYASEGAQHDSAQAPVAVSAPMAVPVPVAVPAPDAAPATDAVPDPVQF